MDAKPAHNAQARRAAWQRGQWAETLCAVWLVLKGYRIVARGRRGIRHSGQGEVDLIAAKGGVLAFIEVKARANRAGALDAIGPRQQARIARAAQGFVGRNPRFAPYTIRFDAMLVTPFAVPRHVRGAFEG